MTTKVVHIGGWHYVFTGECTCVFNVEDLYEDEHDVLCGMFPTRSCNRGPECEGERW